MVAPGFFALAYLPRLRWELSERCDDLRRHSGVAVDRRGTRIRGDQDAFSCGAARELRRNLDGPQSRPARRCMADLILKKSELCSIVRQERQPGGLRRARKRVHEADEVGFLARRQGEWPDHG